MDSRHDMRRLRWAAAVHEAAFGAAPERSAATGAGVSALEQQLAVVAPDGHAAFVAVMSAAPAPWSSTAALAERVQEALCGATGRAVRCFESAGPMSAGAWQAESRSGAVTLSADAAWLEVMPVAPVPVGTTVEVEIPLPPDVPPGDGVYVPESATGSLVIEGSRCAASLDVSPGALVAVPDAGVAAAPPARARFAAVVRAVDRGAWSLEVQGGGAAVWPGGWGGRAVWVTDGARMGIRVAGASMRIATPPPAPRPVSATTATVTAEVGPGDIVDASELTVIARAGAVGEGRR